MPSESEAQAALVAWSVSFEAAAGRPPTETDKATSAQYQSLKKAYKKARDGGGGHREKSRERSGRSGHHRDGGHHRGKSRERSRGREHREEPTGGGGRKQHGHGREGGRKNKTAALPPGADASAEVAKYDRMLSHWEDDFLAREGRRADSTDHAQSRFYTSLYHKKLAAQSELSSQPATTAGMSRPLYGINKAATAGYGAANRGDASAAGCRDGYAANAASGLSDYVPDERRASLVDYASVVASKVGGSSAPSSPAGPSSSSILGPDEDYEPSLSADMSEGQLAKAVAAFRKHDINGDGKKQQQHSSTPESTAIPLHSHALSPSCCCCTPQVRSSIMSSRRLCESSTPRRMTARSSISCICARPSIGLMPTTRRQSTFKSTCSFWARIVAAAVLCRRGGRKTTRTR